MVALRPLARRASLPPQAILTLRGRTSTRRPGTHSSTNVAYGVWIASIRDDGGDARDVVEADVLHRVVDRCEEVVPRRRHLARVPQCPERARPVDGTRLLEAVVGAVGVLLPPSRTTSNGSRCLTTSKRVGHAERAQVTWISPTTWSRRGPPSSPRAPCS